VIACRSAKVAALVLATHVGACEQRAAESANARSGPQLRDGSFEARLRALEQRVAEIEQRTRPARPPGIPIDAAFEGSLDLEGQFRAERRDASWADEAEKSFEADMKKAGRRHGILSVRVECRDTMCKVTAEYPSESRAMQGSGDIAHGEHRLNCARAGGGLAEESGRGRYRIFGYFMCENLRRDR
jgi:hypothetical protein